MDRVLLVGCQTKEPGVRRALSELTGVRLSDALDPAVCVAQGAAVQAAVLEGRLTSVLLLDATPFSLGIETAHGAFSRVIARNTQLPARQSQLFTTTEDGQESVSIRIYQGESALAAQNVLLGEFVLSGLQKAPRGVPRIRVEFDIDQNGVVGVKAVDEKTGEEQRVEVRFGEQRARKSEKEALRETLEKEGVALRGDESLERLRALHRRAQRRGRK